jgi:copper/silver efflux system protein
MRCQVMLVYLNHAAGVRASDRRRRSDRDLIDAIVEGATLRVRPIAMTVAVIIAGLLPVYVGYRNRF